MTMTRGTKAVLWVCAVIGFGFIYVPLGVILINSFSTDKTLTWPPSGFTTEWWGKAIESEGVRAALWTSVWVAVIATLVALVLGTLLSFALGRYRFFGRESISLLVILPIALPGIVTGIALNNVFTTFLGGLTIATLVIGHATFCIVVAFNNVIARLRRVAPNLREASADLGASEWQTLRFVTWPLIRSAVVAGGILAFALSFDEVVVTTFTAGAGTQTLPQWILNNFSRPNVLPYVTVVATIVLVVSLPLAWLAQRLSDSHLGE